MREYGLVELLCKTQDEIANIIISTLKGSDLPEVIINKGKYIVGKSEGIKPMLCIHLDTINTHHNDRECTVADLEMINEDTIGLTTKGKKDLSCLGGDDRAGVYVALKLLLDPETRDKYHYGFFYDEEVGGRGSNAYAIDIPEYEDTVSAFIGLDRRGYTEVATYGSDNKELIEVFTNIGYIKEMGSFTDASCLAGTVSCINLSVGYMREHTTQETQCIKTPLVLVEILKCVADVLGSKVYEVESVYGYDNDDKYWGSTYDIDTDDRDRIAAYEEFIEMMGYNPDEILNKYIEGLEW